MNFFILRSFLYLILFATVFLAYPQSKDKEIHEKSETSPTGVGLASQKESQAQYDRKSKEAYDLLTGALKGESKLSENDIRLNVQVLSAIDLVQLSDDLKLRWQYIQKNKTATGDTRKLPLPEYIYETMKTVSLIVGVRKMKIRSMMGGFFGGLKLYQRKENDHPDQDILDLGNSNLVFNFIEERKKITGDEWDIPGPAPDLSGMLLLLPPLHYPIGDLIKKDDE